ncbi:MAG: arginine repressor [Oscillospiraceae bacterium]|nr:arginine repressor [Oscillospiraceae bacterium]
MKQKRQEMILNIISNNDVDTQSRLMELLKESGFSATQATLSRDIRELRLVKVMTDTGIYKYDVPTQEKATELSTKFRSIFSDAVVSVDYAFHIVVLKCHTGMASAACAALDNMKIRDVVGSLAGDDTIFVLLRNEQQALKLVSEIRQIIKG